MSKLCLVTGANGHLGNNLVRYLLNKGFRVRAGVRNRQNSKAFAGLDCEIVLADLLDKKSLNKAMQGVDYLCQVAAVFKHWSKDLEQDIVQPNIKGTKNVIEAAAEQKVKKIVYISSVAALDHSLTPMNETTWNKDYSNSYYKSKTEAEKLAWDLAEKLNLWMVSILPSAIIGPNSFGHLTPTMQGLFNMLHNNMPFDPKFHFNFIDVDDVVKGIVLAFEHGRKGERYLLANEDIISSTRIFELARIMFPKNKKPAAVSKSFLFVIAAISEFVSIITKKSPQMLRSWIRLYYQTDLRCDISKAKKELGFEPKSTELAVKDSFHYLNKVQLNGA